MITREQVEEYVKDTDTMEDIIDTIKSELNRGSSGEPCEFCENGEYTIEEIVFEDGSWKVFAKGDIIETNMIYLPGEGLWPDQRRYDVFFSFEVVCKENGKLAYCLPVKRDGTIDIENAIDCNMGDYIDCAV